MTVPRNQCRVLKRSEQKPLELERKTRQLATEKMQPVSREIDIRGMNNEEAAFILEKYIDDAILTGLDSVAVIHGKGTGALRKGVQAFLSAHPRVKGITIGEINQGGTGVSVVKLA
jgi:DNA mismatch repair protein MutS2